MDIAFKYDIFTNSKKGDTVMAIAFKYDVVRIDGSGFKSFRNQKKAEEYARSLKRTEEEKIQITRTAKGYAPYVYYV